MFSETLRTLRAEKGFSQGQLAKAINVSPGNVSDWETDKSKPGYNALAALARIFEVSADYLLELDVSPEKKGVDLSDYKNEQGLTCDGSPLDAMEADVVAMFRLLPERHQEEIFDLIYFKYQRHVEEKKGSIFSTYKSENEQQKSGSDDEQKARHETA